MSDVIELNAAAPTVESILRKLSRRTDEIADLVCMVGWKNGAIGVSHSAIRVGDLAIVARVLQGYADTEILNDLGGADGA